MQTLKHLQMKEKQELVARNASKYKYKNTVIPRETIT
jgi:hypothetical protein